MKKINIVVFSFLIFIGCSSSNPSEPEMNKKVNHENNTSSIIDLEKESLRENSVYSIEGSDKDISLDKASLEDKLDTSLSDIEFSTNIASIEGSDKDIIYSDLSLETTLSDIEILVEEELIKVKGMSSFEKIFINHSAYIYYTQGITALYEGDYKEAYKQAMNAMEILDNTEEEQFIALPYMPNYVREGAYGPKTIYYKIIKYEPYELKRLITKAKLISPPIPTVVINRTSTHINLIIKNFGDLPLDEFEVILNDEIVASFDKVLPNEEKIFRIENAPELYEISFKEKYGFAPDSFILNEDE